MVAVEQGQVFLSALQAFWLGVISVLPGIILAVLIFIIGVLIAVAIGKAVAHLVNLTRVNSALEKTALKEYVNKAGFHLNVGGLIGWLVKWFFILAFLVASLNVLGLSEVTLFLQQIVLFFLPRVIVAVLIVVVGSVLANVAGRAVEGSARVANLASASFVAAIARWAIWVTTILFALNHLGIGTELSRRFGRRSSQPSRWHSAWHSALAERSTPPAPSTRFRTSFLTETSVFKKSPGGFSYFRKGVYLVGLKN